MANRAYKGRRFEIWLAGELSKWWTGGARDDIFWHTGDSGGRATKRTAKGKGTAGLYGDIKATDPLGFDLMKIFTIECKKGYPRDTVHDLFDWPMGGAAPRYHEWLEKAESDAKAAGSLSWLLVHKRDRRDAIAVMPLGIADRLFAWLDGSVRQVGIVKLSKLLELAPDQVRGLL